MKKKVKIKPQPNTIICSDNLKVIKKWKKNCIDSIICDPQYGLGFMGQGWDKVLPNLKTWSECLRIAKPGAIMLCFGGTRTFHRVTCAIEDAGWQIRDCLIWLYGSGFPKSKDIGKEFDRQECRKQLKKKLGRKPTKKEWKKAWKKFRKVIGKRKHPTLKNTNLSEEQANAAHGKNVWSREWDLIAPTTKLAKLWDGYGTGLKPSWEPIIVAMKPVEGNFAKNAEKHGVAGLNIDGGRIGTVGGETHKGGFQNKDGFVGGKVDYKNSGVETNLTTQGRWPANLILDEESARLLDRQSGIRNSGGDIHNRPIRFMKGTKDWGTKIYKGFTDSGGASRFFYIAKASRGERNAGCDELEKKEKDIHIRQSIGRQKAGEMKSLPMQNFHPTVKPLELMQYLCMLLKMPNKDQIILDPFMDSGTTCVACKELGINYIGIEKEPKYFKIARKRLKHIRPNLFTMLHEKPKEKKTTKAKKKATFGLCE